MPPTDPSPPPGPQIRKGQGDFSVNRQEFEKRFRQRFYDPAFEKIEPALASVIETAWGSYHEYRKAPRTRKAGPGFADPEMELPIEWLDTRARIQEAQRTHDASDSPSRVLVICAAARNDQTCPGEMSKTFRLVSAAREIIQETQGFEVDLLDLSALTAEYGRVIYPCKACVSTAMPLCNWPCSCYPNHAMGQSGDWMAELYPRWVAAHGIMIVTPVYWYQAPSTLKLMMDRLVCADGGNPDPTATRGKNPAKAKALELAGWHYPRHLAGRAFSVVVHGDAAGVEALTSALTGWLTDMHLVPADAASMLGRYVGYYEPYATSHEALDRDQAVHDEVRNAARALVERVRQIRSGAYQRADRDVKEPRPK